MNKKVLKGLFAVFLGVGLTSSLVRTNDETKASEVNANAAVKELLSNYYNEGVYIKDSSIKFDSDKLGELSQYFHAGSTILDRTTYYNGNSLWMTRDKGHSEFSFYGSAANNGGVTNATAPSLAIPTNFSIALSGEGKESMENYYVTLKDISEATYDNVWTNKDGVYTTSDNEIINNFRLFTAPCFLNYEENGDELANYLNFTKATVWERTTSIVLSLYVDGTDSGKVTSEADEDGDYLFSQAVVLKGEADVWDSITVSSSLKGTGEETSPYLISSGADLAYFRDQVNSGNTYEGKYIELTKNIELNNFENFMIGDSSTNNFAGIFNGGEFAVRGININRTDMYSGLFCYVHENGKIENLSVYGHIKGGTYTGSLIGYMNASTIVNCTNYINLETTSAGIGGITSAINGQALIKSCTNYGSITTCDKTYHVGGITGVSWTATAIIDSCVNYGDVISSCNKDTTDSGTGGIIGTATSIGSISNCVNYGNISSTVVHVGGIAGMSGYKSSVSKVIISNCENNGDVTSTASIDNCGIGGILGTFSGENYITNCTNNGNIDSPIHTGGIVGYVTKGLVKSSINNGNVSSTGPRNGGIVGEMKGAEIFDCTNNGSVSGVQYIGGITGTSGVTKITNCVNTGSVNNTSTYSGGILGCSLTNAKTEITKCSNSGSITATQIVGGIAGCSVNTSSFITIKECTNTGSINGSKYTGDIVGYQRTSITIE